MIEILHHDRHVVAAVKPFGLSTTAPPGADSLEQRLRDQLPAHTDYLHAVHRLDACVGGIVLLAISKRAARLLGDQFASRKVRKTYHAIVQGDVELESTETWSDYLRKSPDGPMAERAAPGDHAAREAITLADVAEHHPGGRAGRTHLRLKPQTGRMHQLRFQCALRGHPIRGDSLYGPDGPTAAPEMPTAIALWASRLTFHDPRSAKSVTLQTTLPPSFWDLGLNPTS